MSRNVTCDIQTGICEVNLDLDLTNYTYTAPIVKDRILVEYFTDPLCSACYVLEPIIQEFIDMYGSEIDYNIIMGGMIEKQTIDSETVEQLAKTYEEMGDMFNMPMSGDVLRNDPFDSSYPPSLAYLAALSQDRDKSMLYLRLLREAVFVHSLNITKESVLIDIAKASDLDVEQFMIDLYSEATLKQLEDNIAYTISNGVSGFPSTVIYKPNGESTIIRGVNELYDYEKVLLNFGLEKQEKIKYDFSNVLSDKHYMSLREINDRLNLYFEDTAELYFNKEYVDKRADKIKVNNGHYYKKL